MFKKTIVRREFMNSDEILKSMDKDNLHSKFDEIIDELLRGYNEIISKGPSRYGQSLRNIHKFLDKAIKLKGENYAN